MSFKEILSSVKDAYCNKDLLEYLERFREFGHNSEELGTCILWGVLG